MTLEVSFMLLESFLGTFIVQVILMTIVIYDCHIIVQATGQVLAGTIEMISKIYIKDIVAHASDFFL